jgi:predicted ATPase/DNA-binding XRE family transcriptional regulator
MDRRGRASGSFTTFGEMLRHLRRRAGLTQTQLGIAVGYSNGQITRLENGDRAPDVAIVRARFVDALNLQDENEMATRLIQLAESLRKETRPTAPSTRRRSNLRVYLTPFIGREREVGEVKDLLSYSRLLTLTGSGGVGKTRLAVEAAAALVGEQSSGGHLRFADGVWLAELAPISDPALMADTVAAAIELRPTSRPALAVLIDFLCDKELLLILDNCEHLIQACAELAVALLRACPRLRILATSREYLNVAGETAWRVPSLSAAESLQLFTARASAARADFALSSQNTSTVTDICRRLDGIPLAIELAASRVSALSVEQLAARLGNRFQLLTGGSRTALPRHQTLRALIDWSYNLLTEPERTLLRQLSVFAGGWTAEAAEQVCSQACPSGCDILILLLDLVDKSLVVVDDRQAETRYRLLETIRQYASEKLAETGELEQTQRQHLAFFTELAQTAKPHLHRQEQVLWLDRLEAEIDNLRAALEWVARHKNTQAGERLIDGIWWFWFQRAYLAEGIKWIGEVLLADHVADTATRVKANAWMGWLGVHKGNIEQIRVWFNTAAAQVRSLNDARLLHLVLCGWGMVVPDFEEATRLLDEALAIAQQAGWQREQAQALWILGTRMRRQGDPQRATQVLTQGLALARAVGDRYISAQILLKLGLRALDRAEYEHAHALLEESVALARELGAEVGIADSLIELGTLGVRQCDFDLARPAIRECVIAYGKAGNVQRLAQCVSMAAGIADALGHIEQAARLLAAAATARTNLSRRLEYNSTMYEEYDRLLPRVRAELDPAAFERAWAEGCRLTLNQALQEALAV